LAHNLKLSNSAIVISSCRAFFLFVRRPVGYIMRRKTTQGREIPPRNEKETPKWGKKLV